MSIPDNTDFFTSLPKFILFLNDYHELTVKKVVGCKNINHSNYIKEFTKQNLYLYAYNYSMNYKTIEIDKKNGGKRSIDIPSPSLKKIQQYLIIKISDYLIFNTSKLIKHEYHSKSISFAYKSKHKNVNESAIFLNAYRHKNKNYVLNIDLKDYFHDITFSRIKGYLQKNKYFKADEEVAKIISNIATYNGRLPQGGALSPLISNLISETLDYQLSKIARKYKCNYSRYADDITFSTNKKSFIEKLYSNNKLSNELESIIKKNGFKINYDKVRLQTNKEKQIVNGLVVNKKVNISRKKYNEFRKNIYQLMRITDSHNNDNLHQEIRQYFGRAQFYIDIITSPKNHFEKINLNVFTDLKKRFIKEILLLYFAKHFVFNYKTTIFVEGPSDKIIYKKILKGKDIKGDYDFIYHSPKFFKQIFKDRKSANTGTTFLSQILKIYINMSDIQFKDQNSKPIIFIVDNDSAGKSVIKPFCENGDYFKNGLKAENTDIKSNCFDIQKSNCFRKLFFIKPKKENATLETFLNGEYKKQKINVQTENNELKKGEDSKVLSAKKLHIDSNTNLNNLEHIFEIIKQIENLKR